MIKCDKHGGYQMGYHVSPDLAGSIHAGRQIPPFREVTYCYEGLRDVNFLTESFAAEHEVTEVGDVRLPVDYPDWYVKLIPICEKCVEQAIGRSIDD